MYNKYGRYALMVFFAIGLLLTLYYQQYQLASLAGFLFLFVIWSHIKHSSVALASKHFARQDYQKTALLLAEVPNPAYLAKKRRGFYEFMKANIALKDEDFEAAEYHFQLASRFPLGGKNDKAYVLIHLANLSLRKKDVARTQTYLQKAKELAHTSRAKELIEKIEQQLNKI